MLSQLKAATKVVGVKQAQKAIAGDAAQAVFVAQDAEPRVIRPIMELCKDKNLEVTFVATMHELGEAAGIEVGAAVVVQLEAVAQNS